MIEHKKLCDHIGDEQQFREDEQNGQVIPQTAAAAAEDGFGEDASQSDLARPAVHSTGQEAVHLFGQQVQGFVSLVRL